MKDIGQGIRETDRRDKGVTKREVEKGREREDGWREILLLS